MNALNLRSVQSLQGACCKGFSGASVGYSSVNSVGALSTELTMSAYIKNVDYTRSSKSFSTTKFTGSS